MDSALSYTHIKSELEVNEVETFNDISGSFIKTEVFVGQDEDLIRDIKSNPSDEEPKPVQSIETNVPKKYKFLVLCLKNLTKNDICGYQKHLKRKSRWGCWTRNCDKKDLDKKIDCKICGKFLRPASMNYHMNWHMGQKSYACDICPKIFIKNSNLSEHKLTHNKGVKGQEISDSNFESFPCSKCDKIFNQKRRLTVHIRRMHVVDSSRFPCSQCDESFKFMTYLTRHVNKIHLGIIKKAVCTVCNKSILKKCISQHMKIHAEGKICSTRPFSCPKCYLTFKHLNTFELHEKMNWCRKKRSKTEKTTKKKKQSSEKKQFYKCDICSKEFADFQYFNDHKNSHDGLPIKCQFCAQNFTTRRGLRDHIVRCHTDELKSEVNPAEKKQKETSDSESFPCSKCDKIFKQKLRLTIHNRRMHVVVSSRFPCSQCDQSFKFKTYLNRHVNKVHLGIVKKAVCPVCNKSILKKCMSRHMKIHAVGKISTRPFSCPKCSITFKHRHNLEIHEKIHSCKKKLSKTEKIKKKKRLSEKKQSYKCDICLKECDDFQYFNDHKNSHKDALNEENPAENVMKQKVDSILGL